MKSKDAWVLVGAFIILILLTLSFQRKEGFHTLDYSTYQQNKTVDSAVDKFSIAPVASMRKLTGFDGLFTAPEMQPANTIDVFSNTPGSATAPPISLSNSMGYLQMTKDQLGLLSTRGGNATGVNYGPV